MTTNMSVSDCWECHCYSGDSSSFRWGKKSTSISNDCVGLMMTFLNVCDTSYSGRTCRTWLRIAYDRTPTKSFGDTFVLLPQSRESALERVDSFLQSPHKRHFNKLDLSFRQSEFQTVEYDKYDIPEDESKQQNVTRPEVDILKRLCAGLNLLTEVAISWPNASVNRKRCTVSLLPLLQYHSQTLIRLVLIGVMLNSDCLKVIRQFPALVTLETGAVDWDAIKVNLGEFDSHSKWPIVPIPWMIDDFRALCHPDNQLTSLRDFRFNAVWHQQFSNEHLEFFKQLPLEAITSLTSSNGMDVHFLIGLCSFKYLKSLVLYVPQPTDDTFDLMCLALKDLPLLDTLTLQCLDCQRGSLFDLLQNLSQLTNLTLEAVDFESPKCLEEFKLFPHQLSHLTFQGCTKVGFKHLVLLDCLPKLQRLTHSRGRSDKQTRLAPKQLKQLVQRFQRAKVEFIYDW